MYQRYYSEWNKYIRVIVISITYSVSIGCGNHPIAQVSDRDPPPSRRISAHHVAKGETLYSIAWRYSIDYRELARRNRIPPPYTIYPGQTIHLYGSERTLPRTSSHLPRTVSTPPPMATRPAGPVTTTSTTSRTQSTPVTPPRVVAPPSTPISRSETQTTTSTSRTLPLALVGAPQWSWPAEGRLISGFQENAGLNKGIDIAGNLGQPVLAAAAGQVVYAGAGLRGYGKLLIIKHNESFLSAYAHNDGLLVKEGDHVKAGQRIADMGSSGTDRVKLHFEIRREGVPVNPMKFLPKR